VADPNVESYKKALSAIVDKQGKFDKLKKTFEDGKEAVTKQYDTIRDQLVASLKRVTVPPKSDEKELAKVSEWLEGEIKKKCEKIAYFMTPNPQVNLDAKAKKLVDIGMGFAYKC
jgi:hypothetical protein